MAGLTNKEKQDIIAGLFTEVSDKIKPVEMTVTNSDGRTFIEKEDGPPEIPRKELVGTFGYYVDSDTNKKNPYMFWAATSPNAEPSTDDKGKTVDNTGKVAVSLVMPLGGDMSGLYRFPKIGEKVLVESAGAAHYMMGYVSVTGSQFEDPATEENLLTRQGEVFRYRQTGKKTATEGTEKYSELGFYHTATQWEADAGKVGDYGDVPSGSKPLIDLVNIHSTGDIHESAVNHHQIQAQRLELVANDNEGGNMAPEIKTKTFKRGDIHINAGQDITIEAGSNITLKVGRGVITISDTGITISHQLMRNLPNLADAGISMNARDGVTISGEAVSINADHDWTIGEKLGSSVTGSAGALALGGREIAADVPAWMSQLGVNFAYNVNAIQKATVGSYALTSPTSKDNPAQKRKSLMAQAFLSGIKNLGDMVFAFLKFQGLYGKFKNYNTQADPLAVRAAIRKKVNDLDTAVHQATPENRAQAQADLAAARAEQERIRAAADAISGTGKGMDVSPGLMYLGSSNTPPFEKFAIAMKLLLSIANGAFKGAERGMTNAQTLQGDVLDQFNYASIVVVNGIITGLTDAQLGLTAAAREEGTAGLTLTFDGGIIAKAARKQSFYAITEEKGAAPAPLIASWVFWASAAAAMIPKAVTFGIGIDKAVAAINEVDKTKVEETL